MRERWERLRWARREAGYKTATEAAGAMGAVKPTYLSHENGSRDIERDPATRYAQFFGVSLEWLLTGRGRPRSKSQKAAVQGFVGAGAEVVPVEQVGSGIEEVDLPPGAPPGAIAVIVRGDSMYPRYVEGEKLFYGPERLPAGDLVGKECVIALPDGRMLVKRLRRGSKRNLYTLESHNAPPMEDQPVEWAAPVRWVERL